MADDQDPPENTPSGENENSKEDAPTADVDLDAIGADLKVRFTNSGSRRKANSKAKKERKEFNKGEYQGSSGFGPRAERELEALLGKGSKSYDVISDNDLDNQNKKHTYDLRQAFNKLFVKAITIAGFALIVLFIIRIFHIAAPESWKWLKPEAISEMDKIFLGGALGGLLTRHLEKVLGSASNSNNGDGKK